MSYKLVLQAYLRLERADVGASVSGTFLGVDCDGAFNCAVAGAFLSVPFDGAFVIFAQTSMSAVKTNKQIFSIFPFVFYFSIPIYC